MAIGWALASLREIFKDPESRPNPWPIKLESLWVTSKWLQWASKVETTNLKNSSPGLSCIFIYLWPVLTSAHVAETMCWPIQQPFSKAISLPNSNTEVEEAK